MIRITRTQSEPIGMDIGFDSVKLLQLESVGDSLSVVAASRMPLPDDVRKQPVLRIPLAIELIRQMFRSGTFRGRNIVTAMPREIVHVKNLRLPSMPAAELNSAIEFEARAIFPFDTEQAQVRFINAGEVRQGNDARQEVIVLAAKNSDIDDYIEQLNRAGVNVQSLDFEPAAIYRTVERFIRRREDEHEVHVQVDIGARRSQVVIGRGREISFFKPMDIGGQHLHQAIAHKLGISEEEARGLRRRLLDGGDVGTANKNDPVRQAVLDATRSTIEELAREISLCLRYFSVTFRGQRPARLRVCGGEACDPQILQIFNSTLSLPVEAARPLSGINSAAMKSSDRRGSLSEWTVAFGLSLKLTQRRFASSASSATQPSREQKRTDDIPLRAAAEVVDIAGELQTAAATSAKEVANA